MGENGPSRAQVRREPYGQPDEDSLVRSGYSPANSEVYRMLFENAPVGLAYIAADGHILESNAYLLQLLGSPSPEEMGPINVLTLPALQEAGFASDFQRCLETGTPVVAERPYTPPGATSGYIRYHLTPVDRGGHFVGVQGMFEDVSEQKSAEAALSESEQRFRALFESSPFCIVLIDLNNRILQVNPACCEFFGYSQEDIEGSLCTEFLHEEEVPRITALRERLKRGEIQVIQERARFVRKDGSVVWGFLTASLVRDAQGQPLYTVQQILDITQHVAAEEHQRELQRRAEEQEKLAAIGQLAAGLAHDFNNLLTSVMGRAEMMTFNHALPESVRRDAQEIRRQGERAARIVRQILDFSRRSILQKTNVELSQFLRERVELLKRTLPETIQISLFTPSGRYVIHADPHQLQQVLLNLALNARDAMPQGGTLHLHLASLNLPVGASPPIPGMKAGQWVVLSIRDTGTGIEPEHLPHIYEPFFTTKPGQSSGLGLSQAYGIIKQHDGFIDVRSEVGTGTTFTLYLPAVEIQESSYRVEPVADLMRGEGERILVVEDEPVVREVLSRMLQALGYQVISASNGREALTLYTQQRESIDLVLSDVVMPGMGGIDLHRELLRIGGEVKIVLISGYPIGEEILPRGIAGWILKPPTLAGLARVVRRALDEGETP